MLLIGALTGCSNILGIQEPVLDDAGSGAPPNTVIGKVYDRCLTVNGSATNRPFDVSTRTIAALLPDATQPTGFRVIPGAGKPDGTFQIDNVPDGMEYVFRFGNSYFVTTYHNLDYGGSLPQRCDPVPAVSSSSTIARLSIANLSPFVRGNEGARDVIEVRSFNLAYQGQMFPPSPAVSGALTVDWNWSTNGRSPVSRTVPLLNASQGDDLVVLHTRSETLVSATLRRHTVRRIIDAFHASDVTLQDGGITSVTGSFMPAANPRTARMMLTRGLFDGGFDGSSSIDSVQVELHAQPIENDFAVGAALFSVDFNDWKRSASRSETVMFDYDDPFPASWSRSVMIDYFRSRQIQLPGTTRGTALPGGISRQYAYLGGAVTLTPALPPATNIKVGGVDFSAGGMVRFDGVKPVTMTWSGVAGAKVYSILVTRVLANGSDTVLESLVSFTTAGTSIQIPADVFAGSEYFAFELRGQQGPNEYAHGELISDGLPLTVTTVPSGMFRFSATCGNGAVDAGEACDPGIESTTCDVDCTVRACGDGLRNATAGEACDSIGNTESCDSDCTPAACGDGYANTKFEDCDDRNTTDDANGCSADCRFNNVCGNARVEPLVEQCDPGGAMDTAACDFDCTTTLCRDGHRNAAAGEECDDGNSDNTDHCSNLCKVQ